MPTLARLSFWVSPARMTEFEAAYQAKVVPILKAHGLVESAQRGRATPDSIFSRLFEIKAPVEVEEKRRALQGDGGWKEAVRNLGAIFTPTKGDTLRYDFRLYATPAGPGKKVSAGRGTGHWHTYDVMNGLASATVRSIFQDREGNFWFGTAGGGVSRYDGSTFTTFTTQDGLAHNDVLSGFRDQDGHPWFGTWNGVSRYDGKTFTTFTARNGLAANQVWSIFQDRDGNFWFSTRNGVSRYDGKTFTTFTARNGLANNLVSLIFQDRDENLWFGTEGGVSRYNGYVFQTLTRQDGLASNKVERMFQDRDGYLWFGTDKGATRYRSPAPSPPPMFIDAVVADRQYEKVSEIAIPSTVELTVFEFHAISFKTRPDAMIYRYRLKGYDKDWRTTHERRVEYQGIREGIIPSRCRPWTGTWSTRRPLRL